jgi:hypothetical protein
VTKHDYAKWMLEDPRVNFAISAGGRAPGVNHLGLQVDERGELDVLARQLRAADAAIETEDDVTCCYARSDKHWVNDPQGVRWETFHTHGEATSYGEVGQEPQSACGDAGTRAACCNQG